MKTNSHQPTQAFQGQMSAAQAPVQFFQGQPLPQQPGHAMPAQAYYMAQPMPAMAMQPIPGLKVAYGQTAAGAIIFGAQPANQPKGPGLFSRLKDRIIELVTEEAGPNRPIGLSQLSRKTFQAHEGVAGNTIVRSGRGTQDCRFNQLTRPQR